MIIVVTTSGGFHDSQRSVCRLLEWQYPSAMKRLIYVGAVVLLSSLSAFGAAQFVLGLGLGAVAATLACTAAFVGNFLLIEPFEDVIRK